MTKHKLLALAFAASASACSSGGSDGGAPELVGTAQAEITSVPGGVGCIQITAAGFMTVTRSFDVTPGQSSVLSLSKLPTGTVTFSGKAFNSACAMASDPSAASWVAPAVTTTITPGVTGSVTLQFTSNGNETVCANFDEGSDAGDCTDGAPQIVRYGNYLPLTCATGGIDGNVLFGARFVIPAPITLTALGVITFASGSSAILGLYADNGSGPGALIAHTAPTALASGVNEIPVAPSAMVAAGTYWIAGEYSGIASVCIDGTSSAADYASVAFGSLPNPWSPAPTTISSGNINYYVVGTP
jgi:hypothetical protein